MEAPASVRVAGNPEHALASHLCTAWPQAYTSASASLKVWLVKRCFSMQVHASDTALMRYAANVCSLHSDEWQHRGRQLARSRRALHSHAASTAACAAAFIAASGAPRRFNHRPRLAIKRCRDARWRRRRFHAMRWRVVVGVGRACAAAKVTKRWWCDVISACRGRSTSPLARAARRCVCYGGLGGAALFGARR